jgi:hypothetical protein
MNYIVIGALGAAAAIIIGLVIKLVITKAKIKKQKKVLEKQKTLLEQRDHEIMEETAEILKKLPPVNGPEPAKEPDYDNQYTTENSEPLVIAEKDELTELSEKLDEVDTHGNVIKEPSDKLGIIASKPIPVEGIIDEESLKTIGKAVAALEPKKVRKKRTTTKAKADVKPKKSTRKVVKKIETKPAEVKPKRKYTKKKVA